MKSSISADAWNKCRVYMQRLGVAAQCDRAIQAAVGLPMNALRNEGIYPGQKSNPTNLLTIFPTNFGLHLDLEVVTALILAIRWLKRKFEYLGLWMTDVVNAPCICNHLHPCRKRLASHAGFGSHSQLITVTHIRHQ